MNSKAKKYVFQDPKKVYLQRFRHAIKRSETYSFQPYKYADYLSDELKHVTREKFKLYEQQSSIWTDRTSVIAAPLGAEVFLQCERNDPNVLFGAPRYYFHELDRPEQEPDARAKFPYDRVAHVAAKRITQLFRQMLVRRNHAATMIQRNIGGYVRLKHTRVLIRKRQEARALLRKTFRKEKYIHKAQVAIKSAAFLKYVKKQVDTVDHSEIEKRYFDAKFRRIVNWLRKCLKAKRKLRGMQRRYQVHARRIQSLFRGRMVRQMLFVLISSQILIAYTWRKFFRRKYTPYARKIQRSYRLHRLRMVVLCIQRNVRGYLGKTKRRRKQIAIFVDERKRSADELCLLINAVKLNVKKEYDWWSDGAHSPDVLRWDDHIASLDVYAHLLLRGLKHPSIVPPSKARLASQMSTMSQMSAAPPPESLGDDGSLESDMTLSFNKYHDSYQHRITRAVLEIFANYPNNCLDGFALHMCKSYLMPRGNSGLPHTAFANLEYQPMHNVESLCMVLKPTKTLLTRIMIQNQNMYLPVDVLARAVLVQRWTWYVNKLCRNIIATYRNMHPPRRVCQHCLEPMVTDTELHDHRICTRNNCLSWIPQNVIRPIFQSLQKKVEKLRSADYPKLTRKYDISKLYEIYQHRGPNHFNVDLTLPLPPESVDDNVSHISSVESIDGGASILSSKSGNLSAKSSKVMEKSPSTAGGSQKMTAQKSMNDKSLSASKSMSQKQFSEKAKSVKQSSSVTPGSSTKLKSK